MSATETERLGLALMKLEQRVQALKRVFELDEEDDLDVRLGTLEGRELSAVELVDSLMERGLTLSGDITLSIRRRRSPARRPAPCARFAGSPGRDQAAAR